MDTMTKICGAILLLAALAIMYQGPSPVGSMALTAEDCAKPGAKCYANQ